MVSHLPFLHHSPALHLLSQVSKGAPKPMGAHVLLMTTSPAEQLYRSGWTLMMGAQGSLLSARDKSPAVPEVCLGMKVAVEGINKEQSEAKAIRL